MTQIVAGEKYAQSIVSRESDRRARSAFHQLVERVLKPGAAIFDFGAGPGLDARFYAERGFTVQAYDIDPEMRHYFAVHCADFIKTGRIVLDGGGYRDFLSRKNTVAGNRVDLVTSNFAPLNLIDDLQELFAKFHDLTVPDGQVLASVLCPYYVGDMRYGWWWRNALRLWRDGRYSVAGGQAPIVRRRLGNYAAHGAPYFTLERVFPGLPADRNRRAKHLGVGVDERNAWLHLTGCRFMFLLFRKKSEFT